MKIQYISLLVILVLMSACYNYDGPTRKKADLNGTNGYGTLVDYENGTKNSEADQYSNTNSIEDARRAAELNEMRNEPVEDYLIRVAKAIKKAVPSAQIEMLQDSIKVLFPDNILYGNSGIVPKEDIYTELRKLAGLIIKYDRTNVLIVGHTDKKGNEKMNKRLSDLRAGYIEQMLLAYNGPKDRINSWGIGSSSPIASELTPMGAEKNRRVEFIILATVNSDDGEDSEE